MTILYALILFIGLAYFIFKVRWDLHMFQQNSYNADAYFRWMNQSQQPLIKKSDWMFLIGSAICLLPSLSSNIWISGIGFAIGLPFIGLSLLMFHVKTTWQPAKKKLVWTPRVRRLLITAFIWLNLLYTFAFVSQGVWFIWLALLFSVIYSWAFVLCANLTNTPIETAVNYYYYHDAQVRLANNTNLIVIGVTGSYGKTSTKNILGQLLSEKYNVLVTPESYNTKLGVVRTIREHLNPTHDVFVVEMGAKSVGEIKEICDLVHPKMGIITTIGPQHLETFKSFENIIRAKSELFEGITKGGTLFVNLTDENIRKMTLPKNVHAVTFGRDGHKKTDYTVSNEQITEEGTSFNLIHHGKGKERHTTVLKTKLLGSHNVDNLLGAIAIAMELGVSANQINRALYDLYPTLHRLSVSKSPLGYTILDDAFNANPVGSKNALSVLRQMKGNRKIVMTPGMIELGSQQDELNEKLGEYIADTCDYAVLVGLKQTEAIQQGFINKKYPVGKWVVVQNSEEGFKAVNAYAKPEDVLLIENDLPDTFNE